MLRLVGAGKANKEIAAELVISERTTPRTHVSNVLRKIGVSSRTQAAVLAVREGLVAPPEAKGPGRREPLALLGEDDRGGGGVGVPLETKLRGFSPSPEMILRPRLSARLVDSDASLVLFAAPPGFGKTTLLAQWRRSTSDRSPGSRPTPPTATRSRCGPGSWRRSARPARFRRRGRGCAHAATSMSTMRSSRSSSGSSSRSTANWFSSSTTTRPSTTRPAMRRLRTSWTRSRPMSSS